MRPKIHYLAHVIESLVIDFQNPVKADVFDAETYMGKVKFVARRAPSRTISLRVTQRMVLFLLNRWRQREPVRHDRST